MVAKEITLPFYAKITIFLVGFVALTGILYIAQNILIPIVFAILIAILLSPVVGFFTRKKINRIIAISATLLLTFIIIAALGMLIISQASQFSDSWPILVDKFTEIINNSILWVSGYFDINVEKIHAWLLQAKTELISNSSGFIGQTIMTLGNGLVILFLVPVYVFIILFYQPLLIAFIHKLFGSENKLQVNEIVTQIKTVIQRYLFGLVIEAFIVAAMDISALLILGIDFAILLGILGALLNLIPYIGGLVAVALPMMIAITTKSPIYAIYVLVLYYIIQLIDNNYIVPIIVSSKVKINALFSIIVVIAGNALWGVSGMFLSIPLLAIVKLIFDHIESLKPWGFLLGDTMPSMLKIKPIFKKHKK
jgi:predicted PurR-regulated permease PerM